MLPSKYRVAPVSTLRYSPALTIVPAGKRTPAEDGLSGSVRTAGRPRPLLGWWWSEICSHAAELTPPGMGELPSK